MPLADIIRREADSWSRQAALIAKPHDDPIRRVAVVLRNIAGVTEVHGLPGLLGYMACMRYSHRVDDAARNTVIDVIDRVLRGEAH